MTQRNPGETWAEKRGEPVPTAAPRTAARCWPHPCDGYHDTYAHTSGEDPCMCPCHLPRIPGDRVDPRTLAERPNPPRNR